ncbi:unnamed protein product [Blepharisma stoltei]|uniref:Uncharacterized protein n=1 Tax=Blepharisma stoltei TaxID=1481888 RepID=A0AAU9IF50_9CILI|nr:unnamed protein product [Blepharisma stoltei]
MANMIMRHTTISPVKSRVNDCTDLLSLNYISSNPVRKGFEYSSENNFQYFSRAGNSSKHSHKKSFDFSGNSFVSDDLKNKISSLFGSHKQIMNELLNDKSSYNQLDIQEKLKELSLQNSKLVLENIALKKKLANHHY